MKVKSVPAKQLDSIWESHNGAWRDPAAVMAWSQDAAEVDPRLLRSSADDAFWELLHSSGVTLLVTREYEHLVVALSAPDGRPVVSHLALPHPSGLVYDSSRGVVHVALTRNPNQLVTLAPIGTSAPGRPLVPRSSQFYPGRLYMHDLALIGRRLHANAVGENAIVEFRDDWSARRVWWPRAIEGPSGPDFSANLLQLNSIAAGKRLSDSFFTASAAVPSARRPGHRNFPVDRRGVLFSGRTREPVAVGLTRPHSARPHRGAIWIDNSGYGELVQVRPPEFAVTVVARLPGWTRGLCFHNGVAFVGTSRVIPRFRQYAPGLDVDASVCGIHAVEVASGSVLARLRWPLGNQIFAVEAVPNAFTHGLPLRSAGSQATRGLTRLLYSFD